MAYLRHSGSKWPGAQVTTDMNFPPLHPGCTPEQGVLHSEHSIHCFSPTVTFSHLLLLLYVGLCIFSPLQFYMKHLAMK